MPFQKLQTAVGYTFKNMDLLREALTHPSRTHEDTTIQSNQRMEYLGDAVLQLVLTDKIYKIFPTQPEGILTQKRAQLANRHTLCRRAREIDLGHYLLLGKGEESSGGRDRLSNLADAFEALLGAVYLDGGGRAARKLILAQFKNEFKELHSTGLRENPKGQLQELLQARAAGNPVYRVVHESGPDHNKFFEAIVEWQGEEIGRGQGNSKKEAESTAAFAALTTLKNQIQVNEAS